MPDPSSSIPDEPAAPSGSGWEELPPALPPLGILAGLSDRSLLNLAGHGRYQTLAPEEVIIREGTAQDRLWVVVAGRLEISALVSGKLLVLNHAEVGECLGEVSLLDPGPASATVKAVQTSIVWSFDVEAFRDYLAKHAGGGGALLMGIASCLSQRLRQANQLIAANHVIPHEAHPMGYEKAITADNAPVHIGFFDLLRKSVGGGGEQKVKISTKIKM